jgi:hypothetical protein
MYIIVPKYSAVVEICAVTKHFLKVYITIPELGLKVQVLVFLYFSITFLRDELFKKLLPHSITTAVYSYLFSSFFCVSLNADTATVLSCSTNEETADTRHITVHTHCFYLLRHATFNDGFMKSEHLKRLLLLSSGVHLIPFNPVVGVQHNFWSLHTNYSYTQNKSSVSLCFV